MQLIKIGISANFMHPDPQRRLYRGKRILYGEQSMFDLVCQQTNENVEVLPILLPIPKNEKHLKTIVKECDALVLTGGDDVDPKNYGEENLNPDVWFSDPFRDDYEISYLKNFKAAKKPVLAICRGIQILNAAMGGTLYQDVETLHPQKGLHRHWDVYEHHKHEVHLKGILQQWYPQFNKDNKAWVNSIHHQAVKNIAPDFECLAESTDNVVEAIGYKNLHEWFCMGFQWHPEMMDYSKLKKYPYHLQESEFDINQLTPKQVALAEGENILYPETIWKKFIKAIDRNK